MSRTEKTTNFFIDIHIGRIVDEPGPGTLGIFGKSRRSDSSFHAGKHELKIRHERL